MLRGTVAKHPVTKKRKATPMAAMGQSLPQSPAASEVAGAPTEQARTSSNQQDDTIRRTKLPRALPPQPVQDHADRQTDAGATSSQPDHMAVVVDASLAELKEIKCKTHKCYREARSTLRQQPSPTLMDSATLAVRRTGGFLVACTPSGYIADVQEFFGAETLAQRCGFVAGLKSCFPQLKVIIHACHLRRYTTNRAHCTEMAAQMAHPNIIYVVDRFHAKGHVDEWCKQNCCPDAPGVPEIVGNANTSICEITFSWLARYKHMVRPLGRNVANYFLAEMVDHRNVHRSREDLRKVCIQLVTHVSQPQMMIRVRISARRVHPVQTDPNVSVTYRPPRGCGGDVLMA